MDGHNVVPSWIASPKQEYSARTIRSKIHALLDTFLIEFPKVSENSVKAELSNIDWEKVIERNKRNTDESVKEVTWLKGGEHNAKGVLDKFLKEKFKVYSTARNDPVEDALSNLSPYLHFGHICSQTAVLEVLSLYLSQYPG